MAFSKPRNKILFMMKFLDCLSLPFEVIFLLYTSYSLFGFHLRPVKTVVISRVSLTLLNLFAIT